MDTSSVPSTADEIEVEEVDQIVEKPDKRAKPMESKTTHPRLRNWCNSISQESDSGEASFLPGGDDRFEWCRATPQDEGDNWDDLIF